MGGGGKGQLPDLFDNFANMSLHLIILKSSIVCLF